MPTTFMGRDNNGKPCYHVRKTNGLSADAMKSGVQDDTLFHSSLPYLQVLDTIDVGLSGEYSTVRVFNFPASLNNYLNNRYVCLASALLSDGTRVCIDNIPMVSSMIAEGSYDYGTAFIRPRGMGVVTSVPTSGFYFLNTAIYSSDANGDVTVSGLYNSGYWPDSTVLNNSTGSGSMLQSASRTCIYRRSSTGKVAYLVPVSIRFIVLNMTSLYGYLNYSTMNYSGDIRLSHDGFFIGGTNILAGKGFLAMTASNLYNGHYTPANDYIGGTKISLSNLNSLTLPYGSSLQYFSNPGVSVLNGFLSANGMVLSAPSTGGTLSQKEQWSSESRATSRVSTYENKLKIDTFKITNIPSNTSGCTFTRDNLTVNGVQLYSPDSSNLINLNTTPTRLAIPAIQGIAISSFNDGSVEIVSSFSINKPNSKLGLLFNISHYSNPTNVVITSGGIGSTNTVTSNMSNYSSSEFLGANLAILEIGDCLPICNINCSMNVEISLATSQGKYSYWGIGCGVSYFFYRLDTNTVQIIRRYSKFNFGANTTSLTTSIPGFYLSYLQMTTTSI